MTATDYLGGVTLALVLVGIVSVILAFLTALALSFRSQGPLWLGMLILTAASLSTIGIGLVIACFSKTVTQAFLIANFPLGLMMFFSGAIYPIPRVPLFNLFGHSIGLYDILPPTHAVIALNKVLTLGAGLRDVVYELAALVVLSGLYFGIGVWLFRRTHLRAA
jgi:ABC-2 type transport system permease protein